VSQNASTEHGSCECLDSVCKERMPPIETVDTRISEECFNECQSGKLDCENAGKFEPTCTFACMETCFRVKSSLHGEPQLKMRNDECGVCEDSGYCMRHEDKITFDCSAAPACAVKVETAMFAGGGCDCLLNECVNQQPALGADPGAVEECESLCTGGLHDCENDPTGEIECLNACFTMCLAGGTYSPTQYPTHKPAGGTDAPDSPCDPLHPPSDPSTDPAIDPSVDPQSPASTKGSGKPSLIPIMPILEGGVCVECDSLGGCEGANHVSFNCGMNEEALKCALHASTPPVQQGAKLNCSCLAIACTNRMPPLNSECSPVETETCIKQCFDGDHCENLPAPRLCANKCMAGCMKKLNCSENKTPEIPTPSAPESPMQKNVTGHSPCSECYEGFCMDRNEFLVYNCTGAPSGSTCANDTSAYASNCSCLSTVCESMMDSKYEPVFTACFDMCEKKIEDAGLVSYVNCMNYCTSNYVTAACDDMGTCHRHSDRAYFNCSESDECMEMVMQGFGGSCLEANCTQYNMETPTDCHEKVLDKCELYYGELYSSAVSCFRTNSSSCKPEPKPEPAPEPAPEPKPQPERKYPRGGPKSPAQCDTMSICQRNQDEVYFDCSNTSAAACVKEATRLGGDPSCLETVCADKTPSGPIPYATECYQRVQEACEENCEPFGDFDTELHCNLNCLKVNLTSCNPSRVLGPNDSSKDEARAKSRLTVGTSIVVTLGAIVLTCAAAGWIYKRGGLCCCKGEDAPVIVDLSEDHLSRHRQGYLPIISEQA